MQRDFRAGFLIVLCYAKGLQSRISDCPLLCKGISEPDFSLSFVMQRAFRAGFQIVFCYAKGFRAAPSFSCPLVVLACESLHVCTVCIWRCEHARFCVEVFYALYINFHSFIHSFMCVRSDGELRPSPVFTPWAARRCRKESRLKFPFSQNSEGLNRIRKR